jgi:predicted PurR-regulated permease PerM
VLSAETASLVLSAVIAAAAAPLVISLRARGWSRVRAALGAWAVVGAIIVGALVLAVIAFVPSITALVDEVQRGVEAIRSGSGERRLPPEIASTIAHVATVITGFIEDELGALASHVATAATIAILSTFLTFFFLLDGDHGAEWVLQGVPDDQRAALRDRGRDAALRVAPRARDSGLLRGPNGGDVRGHAGAGTPFLGHWRPSSSSPG